MFLVFDIGGTKVRIGTSLDGKKLDNFETIPTQANFQEFITSFKKTALNLTQGQKVDKAIGGLRNLNSPQISLWPNEPLKEELEGVLETSIYLENDAALVGLGEAVFGAGKGQKIVAYITVSTGIGGARIVEGKIDQNSIGFEPGNQIISVNPPQTLENLISGDAIQKKFNQKGEEVKDLNFWDETAKTLAVGLNNVIVFWSPDIVVLGGPVIESIPLDKVNSYLSEVLKIFPKIPPIVKATLGEKGGLLGALATLSNHL